MQDMLGDKVLVEGRVLSSYAPDIPILPESKRLLTESARLQQAVEIRYRLRDGRLLPMRVSPRFFFRRKDTIWMEALCHHARHYKSYRLERIASVHLLPDAEQMEVEPSLWL
jgi:predicted DNA-binding transcriptional regulator YafY